MCDCSDFDEKARARREEIGGPADQRAHQQWRLELTLPSLFHKFSDEEVSGMVEMNVNSMVWMTKMVIDGMAERKREAIVHAVAGGVRCGENVRREILGELGC